MRLKTHENRWVALASTSLVVFAILVITWHFVITWQFWHLQGVDFPSIAISCIRSEQLAKVSNYMERNQPTAGLGPFLDLALPQDARIFLLDMTGPTNHGKIGYYYFATYYLFPREISVCVDQPTRITKDGFLGRTAKSDQEMLDLGFDIKLEVMPDGSHVECNALRNLPVQKPVNPAWFDSKSDQVIAFLLPWLTALAGMWLFRLVFPTLSGRMPLLEQLACSLGLGMMAVAALTLGVKLSGFSAHRVILAVTAVGAIAEMWHDRKVFWKETADGLRKLVRRPVAMAIGVAGLLVFLILFRLAGLQGLVEFDAVAAWALKAKILHLYHGKELVQWFSSPRLAYAHLDYPTLVPSLHAATYDSLGHVDEFVTKFWPAWMLLFLLLALASSNRGRKSRPALLFGLLGLLLLPVTQKYVQLEGGTVPMVFFTVLGFVQCALWLVGKDRARLGLGLTLLFGAAMAKFEGFIFLALVGGWMLLWPSILPSLKPTSGFWRGLAFCLLVALPFFCLRVQIPSLHYESGWAGYALYHPGHALSTWPGIFLILLARLFVSSDFASWSGEGGRLQWTGRWDGFSSLYNHSTLGLAWLCLLLAVALWYAVPSRRGVIVWTLAMLVGVLAAFSGVFASFVNVTDLTQVVSYTADDVAGRYLLPVLWAWFATLLTVLFAEVPAASPIPSRTDAKPSLAPMGKNQKTRLAGNDV